MSEQNGGPAFPRPASRDQGLIFANARDGMSLLDYFAGEALPMSPHNRYEHDKTAEWCYLQADAMIRERAKREDRGAMA